MKTNLLQKNIPKGWEVRKVEDILTLEYGKPLKESDRISGNIPVFGSNGIVGFNNTSLVKGPGVIVGRKGGAGEVMFSGKDFYPIDTTYFVKTDLDKKFTYYLLVGLDLKKHSGGSAVPGLSRKDAHNKKVLIPKKEEEQKKIAEILSSVDEEIQKVEEIISATEKLKQGLLGELLIGNNSEKIIKLGDIATIVRGGSPRPIEKFITDEPNGLNWLKIGDIKPGSKYIAHTSQKIKTEGLNKTTMVHIGDFILSNSMSFGRPYIMKIDACIHDGWLAFKEIKTDLVTTEFLYYLLSSGLLQANFASLATGSGVKNLKRQSVANISVKLPSIKEQEKIVNILSSVDSKITISQNLKSKLLELKKGLMSDLLSGKVRTI